MLNEFSRTELLIGSDALNIFRNSKVSIFGIGGVGGYVVEALARSGIGEFHLIDNDIISITNINRQIVATNKTIGKYKVDIMKERILDINPKAIVNTYKCFFLPDTKTIFDFSRFDYIVDAIDTITSKIELVVQAKNYNIPIISSMGTGNKLNPMAFEVIDIYKTSVCPLAKVMRKELRKRNIDKLKVVYSKEEPIKNRNLNYSETTNKRSVPSSISFVPSVAGLIIASEVLKDLAKIQ